MGESLGQACKCVFRPSGRANNILALQRYALSLSPLSPSLLSPHLAGRRGLSRLRIL